MRSSQCSVREFIWMICLAGTALIMAGCRTHPPAAPPPPPAITNSQPDRGLTTPLQINDSITISLTGTPQDPPSFDRVIGDDGTISIAYINHPIQAAGKSPQELEEIIHTNLVPRIYRTVNVTVLPNERYFYVLGEVNNVGTGRQLYKSRITVTKAIATGNGFSVFAAKHKVQVTRLDGTILKVDCVKALKDPKLDLEVLPGDQIYVPRRTFWDAITGQ